MDLKDPGSNIPGGTRRENVPPPDATNRVRSTESQEEASRARRMLPPGTRAGPSASPNRRPPPRPRPRRNSESSVQDFDSMALTEEEKMMISRRRERERSKREPRPEGQSKESREKREPRETKEGRERSEGKSRSKSGRPNRRVDIIDQLDATGIYGTGCKCHGAALSLDVLTSTKYSIMTVHSTLLTPTETVTGLAGRQWKPSRRIHSTTHWADPVL